MPYIQSSAPSEKNDVELMFPGDRFPVTAGPNLCESKWRGGVFVQYVSDPRYDFTVELSDGNGVAGFLLFPSEKYEPLQPGGDGVASNANWISSQPATGVGGQNVVTMVNGGTRGYFKVYETRMLVGGNRVGPLITYSLNESLKVSENGLLTNDSDGDLATVGITSSVVVGTVSAVPSARNLNRLGVDLKY